MPTESFAPPQPDLSLSAPETALAHDMLGGHASVLGYAALNFTMDIEGKAYLQNPLLTAADTTALVEGFRREPKEQLAGAREALFAVGSDKHATLRERQGRVSKYLDAYTNLTIKLDHAAYPASKVVRPGVPEYLPDGFVDMGGESSLNPLHRKREMVRVDKAEIIREYKPYLTAIFTKDYGNMGLQERKAAMLETLAGAVYAKRPYSKRLANGEVSHGGGVVDLSKLEDFVCRHQALEFQVLAQVVGLKSKLFKCRLAVPDSPDPKLRKYERHAANLVRIDGKWHIVDVTNPDYTTDKDGSQHWKLAKIPLPRPPIGEESITYGYTMPVSRQRLHYRAHGSSFWHIAYPAGA